MNPILAVRLLIVFSGMAVTLSPRCRFVIATLSSYRFIGKKWKASSADPAWKELSHRSGNTDAEIVSNISNLYLSPLSFSQI